jgi:hypothetical protein
MIAGPVLPPRAGGPPRQLVVLLHGYGADGEDLIGLGEPLGEVLPEALFAAPDAPTRCAQNPFGYEWFPLDFEAMVESVGIGVPLVRQVVLDYLGELWTRTGLRAGDTFLLGSARAPCWPSTLACRFRTSYSGSSRFRVRWSRRRSSGASRFPGRRSASFMGNWTPSSTPA